MKVENKHSLTKDKASQDDLLSLLEFSEVIESVEITQEEEKNREGMMDINGRWIKY